MEVLISIRPKWCELIFSGRKTLELRKTIPKKITPPFKAYVYCTNSYERIITIGPDETIANGTVCAEFICDYILRHCQMANADLAEQQSLVRRQDIYWHSGCGNNEVFGLHISDLRIYDEPKPLKQFQIPTTFPARRIRQAPQSWCYVEEKS